jgi:hypothetical protein
LLLPLELGIQSLEAVEEKLTRSVSDYTRGALLWYGAARRVSLAQRLWYTRWLVDTLLAESSTAVRWLAVRA